MSSVCMKYPICSETKGALLLKFHFHTPPPLPPARPPDTLPSSHPAQPARDRAGVRRQAGSVAGAWAQRSPRERVLIRLQVRWRPWRTRAGSSWGGGPLGLLGWPVEGWGPRWPLLWAPLGPGPGRALMSGTEMPALLLTETTCVSQAAGQRSRQA